MNKIRPREIHKIWHKINRSYLKNVMNVQNKIEHIEGKPGQSKDYHNWDEKGMGSSLPSELVLQSTILLLDMCRLRRGVLVVVMNVGGFFFDNDTSTLKPSVKRRSKRLAQSPRPLLVLKFNKYFSLIGILLFIKLEASYFDQFNMTKNGSEYDWKKFTPMNVNIRTLPKNHSNEH